MLAQPLQNRFLFALPSSEAFEDISSKPILADSGREVFSTGIDHMQHGKNCELPFLSVCLCAETPQKSHRVVRMLLCLIWQTSLKVHIAFDRRIEHAWHNDILK